MKKLIVVTLLSSFLLTGCFAGTNPSKNVPNTDGKVAGFFNGVWDGAIAPISFIVSLFVDDVEVYNVHSSGWYTFGFLWGIGALTSTSASSTKRDR